MAAALHLVLMHVLCSAYMSLVMSIMSMVYVGNEGLAHLSEDMLQPCAPYSWSV